MGLSKLDGGGASGLRSPQEPMVSEPLGDGALVCESGCQISLCVWLFFS